MAAMNIYHGPSAIKDYYDPEKTPPLPMVELPEHLNSLYHDNVHIYAKMMTMLPAHNVKALPALSMLSNSVPDNTRAVVEYSSGSTVISMAIINRILHGITDTTAFISNKTSQAKLRMLQFFGLNVQLFGGPSQPEPCDDRGGIQRARMVAEQSTAGHRIVNPNQYENDENWNAHRKWTGPQILAQLPQTTVVCAGMGTAGTMTGIGTYMKEAKPSVVRVGVCTAPGDRVPGPRSFALLAPVMFPWKAAVDHIVEVTSQQSYCASLDLTRNGIVCGPSSGFTYSGLLSFLRQHKAAGTLDSLRDENGRVNCVFICCDLPFQYIDEYFAKVPSTQFHDIKDAHLTEVDLYRYDEAWEVDGEQCAPATDVSETPSTIILDLGVAGDAQSSWRPNLERISLPLHSLQQQQSSPFYDSEVMATQWRELNATLGPDVISDVKDRLRNKTVFVLCYTGDTARVAVSILRAAGIEAFSIRGGTARLRGVATSNSDSPQPVCNL